MRSEILVLEENQRVKKIFEKIFLHKNLKAVFVETKVDCLNTLQNSLDINGISRFSFVILGRSKDLQGSEFLAEKIQARGLHQEVFVLPSNQPETPIPKESAELIEKPFSLISLLTQIEIKNQTNGQQILA